MGCVQRNIYQLAVEFVMLNVGETLGCPWSTLVGWCLDGVQAGCGLFLNSNSNKLYGPSSTDQQVGSVCLMIHQGRCLFFPVMFNLK